MNKAKTIRQVPCPTCGYSFTPSTLAARPVGNYRADVRLCRGRQGLPHIAWDELNIEEIDLIRTRLLLSIQAAINNGILTDKHLESLEATADSYPSQLPLIKVTPASVTGGVEISQDTAHIVPKIITGNGSGHVMPKEVTGNGT